MGIAVPLCPGDYLLFNPKEPHCLSSSCRPNHLVHSISCYLKTTIVGLSNAICQLVCKIIILCLCLIILFLSLQLNIDVRSHVMWIEYTFSWTDLFILSHWYHAFLVIGTVWSQIFFLVIAESTLSIGRKKTSEFRLLRPISGQKTPIC